MAAIDWIIGHRTGPAVINASLGVPASALVDQAVASATNAGIHVVVSAGNESSSACNYSPARSPLAITVGATTSADARASFSNYGSCVSLYAPGVEILSANAGPTNTETRYWQGTSMAAPHVTGAVARYLQGSPNATPAQVKTAITTAATQRIVTGVYLLNHHLLYVDPGQAPAPVVPAPTIGTASSGGFGSPITATARWTAPAGAAAAGVTGYEVQATRYSSGGTALGTWLSVVLPASTTSHVAGLPEQGTWRFRVRSVAGTTRQHLVRRVERRHGEIDRRPPPPLPTGHRPANACPLTTRSEPRSTSSTSTVRRWWRPTLCLSLKSPVPDGPQSQRPRPGRHTPKLAGDRGRSTTAIAPDSCSHCAHAARLVQPDRPGSTPGSPS